MVVLKCKMCGGDLKFEEGVTVAECQYCGTKQTVPNVDNEKKITLFGRANRLRYACEFDKAAGIYESIVADFPEEAEAYWGLVLCKYGIEYVDDPATGEKAPICHRSSFESVMEDDDFEQVLENANPVARSVYRKEAKRIEELRRGIIEVSNREEPYDIFICYKEIAEDGQRTIDSVIAQDVYNELVAKGYRVFFSRITLEDKLGWEYEPYIFAALNSAKIMLAFGTDYEYYNAVWVKNEWSRFLKLIAKGEKKTLIPCYKNIDAYDMPKEFAKLQAQDMGKVGAVQDLLGDIEKLLSKKESSSVTEMGAKPRQDQAAQSPDAMIARGYDFLSAGQYERACKCFDETLNIDEKRPNAYWGLLLAEHQCGNGEELISAGICIDQESNYHFACQYADDATREQYQKSAARALRFGHGYIMELIRKGDRYRASLRAENYAFSKLCDPRLVKIHQTLVDPKAFSRLSGETASALLTLQNIYATDNLFLELEEQFGLAEAAKKEYAAYMDEILNRISSLWESAENLAQIQTLATIWANPCNEKDANDTYLVDDREPRTIGDRYLYLAEHFQMSRVIGRDNRSFQMQPWLEYTFDCYHRALEYGSDKERCIVSKQKFYEMVLENAQGMDQLMALEKESPEDWRVYWQYFERSREQPDCIPIYQQGVKSFLEQEFCFDSMQSRRDAGEHLVQLLETSIRKYSAFPEEQSEKTQVYLEKAFGHAGDCLPAIQKQWEDWFHALEEQCAKEVAQLTQSLNLVQMKMSDENRQYRKLDNEYRQSAIKKGNVCAAVSLFLLVIVLCTALHAWRIMNKPELLLPYSAISYTVAAVAVCLAEMIAFPAIQNKLVGMERSDYPYKKSSASLIKYSRLLTMLAALSAAILFIVGAVG